MSTPRRKCTPLRYYKAARYLIRAEREHRVEDAAYFRARCRRLIDWLRRKRPDDYLAIAKRLSGLAFRQENRRAT